MKNRTTPTPAKPVVMAERRAAQAERAAEQRVRAATEGAARDRAEIARLIESRERRREDGAWISEGFRDIPGLALKVRGDGNVDYERLSVEIYSAATPDQRRSPEFDLATTKRLMRETLLLDWNLREPFTPENVDRALAMQTFRQAVTYASRSVAGLGTETLEADRGK